MREFRYLPDLISSIAAVGIGLAFALFFHTKWYYGNWMPWFGDPPAANPAYLYFVHLFETAPYTAAGLGAGLVAGFGYPAPMRIAIRFAGTLFLFLLLFSRNHHLAFFAFVPVSIGSFLASTGISVVYFRLLGRVIR